LLLRCCLGRTQRWAIVLFFAYCGRERVNATFSYFGEVTFANSQQRECMGPTTNSGASTWCHHPGPLTLPKSARNKDPPEGAGPELVFFFFLIQWNHDGKIKTASKRKIKVKCFNTKTILLKLICFVEEALCFGQFRPATQNTSPAPKPANPYRWVFHSAATTIKMRMPDRPVRGHHDKS
jgi:hypothetical protein